MLPDIGICTPRDRNVPMAPPLSTSNLPRTSGTPRRSARGCRSCTTLGEPMILQSPNAFAGWHTVSCAVVRPRTSLDLVAQDPSWRLIDAWPYGEIYGLEPLWRRLGIAEAITEGLGRRPFGFPVERALFARVAHRACASASKRYGYEQWWAEDVRIEGTEEAIDFRTADRLNLDVELVFYDTTSLHFEIDEEDEGDGEGEVRGSLGAGSKRSAAPRKRGHSKYLAPIAAKLSITQP